MAFAFARSFPTRVERLVLIEPSVFGILHGPEREAIAAILGAFIEAGGMLAYLRTFWELPALANDQIKSFLSEGAIGC